MRKHAGSHPFPGLCGAQVQPAWLRMAVQNPCYTDRMLTFTNRVCTSASLALAAGLALTLAVSMPAQDKGKGKAKQSGVLQPQMNPEGGFEKPMGKLGDSSAEAWSAT